MTDVRAAASAPPWTHSADDATGWPIRVAVVDSGWDRRIAEPRVLPGINFAEGGTATEGDDSDLIGHGTSCADIILQFAPRAEIVPVRVFGTELETGPATLHRALHWVAEHNFRLVNLSLGTQRPDALIPLYRACEDARRRGTIVVASAHNFAGWSFPAIFENTIGVRTGRFESPYTYSYHPGEALECAADGVVRRARGLGGDTVTLSGSSFAAPIITAFVAHILARTPGATLEQVRAVLQQHAARP